MAPERQRVATFEELLVAPQAELVVALGYAHAWLFVADGEDVEEMRLIDVAGAKRARRGKWLRSRRSRRRGRSQRSRGCYIDTTCESGKCENGMTCTASTNASLLTVHQRCVKAVRMAISELDTQIQARIQAFVDEVSVLVRTSAVQAVAEALGNGGPVRRRPGRPRQSAGTVRTAPARRRKGGKRDPRELEALTTRLGDFIKKTPGKRIEEIGKMLGVTTKELALPAKKLIAAETVSTRGARRATKYFPR